MQIRDIVFSEEIKTYASRQESVFKKINKDYNIKITKDTFFQDDYWDLNNKNTLSKKKSLYKYDFSTIDYPYKEYLKKLVLDSIVLNKKSASTVKGSYYTHCRSLIHYLQNNNIYSPSRITTKIIKNYFEKQNWSERTKDAHRKSLIELLKAIELYNDNISYSDIYDYLNTRDTKQKHAQIENGKTKIVPDIIFDKMVSLALKDLFDYSLSIKDKHIASMIIILSETGMRIGEFVRLEYDKVREFEIDEERKVNYLEFITYKIVKNKYTEFRWTETYLTDKAKLAYEQMCLLSTGNKSKYAFYTSKNNMNHCDENTARIYIYRFILRHYDELGFNKIKNKSNLNTIIISKRHIPCLGVEFRHMLGKSIYYFSPHQFRVTMCTRLYYRGVPLEFIRKHMNHLSEEMTCHYIRIKELDPKKLQAINIIKTRVDETGNLLETDVSKVSNELIKQELKKTEIRKEYEAINKFLKKGKFKIMSDIDKIIDILMVSNTPLTETPEGYCARSALVSMCERQEYISTMNDAYNIGLHVPALEYVDITYKKFKDKVKIVNHNKKVADKNNIYNLEYRRELKALNRFVEKRLLPEINLVKQVIENKGIEESVNEYPNLKEIILKINDIEDKEIRIWMK